MPTWNEAAALPALLARVAPEPEGRGPGAGERVDAGDRADEVVVAAGGSTDSTVERALAAGARGVPAARGRGRQLAAGARAATGELLLFLHADCLPAPGALAALRRAFEDPTLGAAGCRQRIDAPGWFYRLVERAADRRVRRGMVYGDSGLCVRRAIYQRAGGFAELELFEDVELCQRLRPFARPRLVPGARLVISARRWQREGRLRATLRNWSLRLAYASGVPPERLARRYRPEPGPAERDRGPR